MTKVTWGVIGCSGFAHSRTIPAMQQAASVDLLAIASRTAQRAHEFRDHFRIPRAYPSYEALLADRDIQAVYIPLPNALHAEWTILAMQSGKHVLCEKPLTSNAAEAVRVADAAAATGMKVMEAFMWRFHPQHERALDAVRSGEIGDPRLVRAGFTFMIERKPNVRLDHTLVGGSVMDVGCYPISGARYYFGAEPSMAVARGGIDPEFGVDMNMGGLLEFANGRALIDSGFHLPERTDIEILGEKGSIRIPKAWVPDDGGATIIVNGRQEEFGPCNHYVLEFERFSRSILDDSPPPFGQDDAVRQMRAVDAVRRSIRSGTPEVV